MKEGTVNQFIQEHGFPEARGVPETGYTKMEPRQVEVDIKPHHYVGIATGHWGADTICLEVKGSTLRINGNAQIKWKEES